MVLQQVTVVGGGFMGAGIAQLSACSGFDVVVHDVSEQAIRNTKKRIENDLIKAARHFLKNDRAAQNEFVRKAISHLSYSWNLSEAVRKADLVIEAIIEKLEAKQALFVEIEKLAPSHAILVSNTSSLRITEIAKPLKRKSQFGGLHFFSPVPVSRLVEIIRIAETTDESFEALKQFAKSIGKEFVVCKDTTGFVVNRVVTAIISTGIKMVEEGIAEVSDIDKAVRLALGHPMGPLELADFVGLDISQNANKSFRAADPTNQLYGSKLLDRKVAEGKLGIKTGEGFYKYPAVGKSKL